MITDFVEPEDVHVAVVSFDFDVAIPRSIPLVDNFDDGVTAFLGRVGSLRENRRAVVVFCGIFSESAPALLTSVVPPCCSKDAQDFIFDTLVNKAFLKAVRPKSEHFRVPKCNYVFSYPRDSTGCLCGLHIANKDRARGILFLAPPRVLVERSHAVWAQSQTQAHKL
jgi:hypothetical protein